MMTIPIAATQPKWRVLTGLAVLVALAHVALLRATPAQLGSGADLDAAAGKTLITRSIEVKSEPVAQIAPSATKAPSAPAAATAVRSAENTAGKSLNQPIAPENTAVAAIETVPATPPLALPDSSPDTTAATTSTATSTVSTLAAPVVTPIAPPTVQAEVAVLPAPAPLPAGPKTTPVTATSLPGSVRLMYKVVGLSQNMTYHANSELAWKSNGDSYEAVMKVSAFLVGSRSMTSVGKLTSIGLAPTRFADKFRAELAAHFNPDQRKITFSANTPDSPWIEGVQDRVSVFFQLGGMLAANPSGFPAGSNVTFLTIGPREADIWTFVVDAEESVDVMGSPMPTLKVSRKPRKEFDQKVEIWYAPSLGYLPVRNRVTQQNGDYIDQQLTEVVKS